MSGPRKVLILGAAGRDFHNFNLLYRDDPETEVVGFTATQIPDIADRRYPPELAGDRYPEGVPIFGEDELEGLIWSHGVDLVLFSYSDVTHEHVMHLAARSVAAGAAFAVAGNETMLDSSRPVVSVTAARTGAGKSQTSRKIRAILHDAGKAVAAIRHPMPYGNLIKQRVQRFATSADLDAAHVTIEEREEYEPYLAEEAVIFAGADYAAILHAAEQEADVVLWDGGNNDFPFIQPDIDICVLDPHRAGHELRYWPGEVNLRRAGVIIINKIETADTAHIELLRRNVAAANPGATVIEAASVVRLEHPTAIEGKRVLVVEDGPTTTHGEMAYGAGWGAAERGNAAEIIDPRPYAVGSIAATFEKFPHLEDVLPAMGYGEKQRQELKETIERANADVVVVGTPMDLPNLLDLDVPCVRVFYDLEERTGPTLAEVLAPVM